MARTEIDPQFGSYMHIRHLQRQEEALLLLKKLASAVKPIMRKRGWKVGELAEFLPPQWNLLGLNVNKGQTIFIRLRHGADPNQFLQYNMLVDTLLHELSHIKWGPHDEKFHKLWDELREEYYALKRQGYTGEGFLGHGRKVGGKAAPLSEIRRQARAAAEKRKTTPSTDSGQRLGGAAPPRGSDMRKVIADAAERRKQITQGCGSGDHAVQQKVEEEARRLGFRTRAEMDDADEIAIAIAMMEGDRDAHRQEMTELGTSQEGLSWSPERGLEMASSADKTRVQNNSPHSATPIKPASSPPHGVASNSSVSTPRPGRPVSRLVATKPAATQTKGSAEVIDLTADSPKKERASQASTWTCEICTLINNMQHLCCDACGVERPESVTKNAGASSPDLAPPLPPRPLGWNCTRCGTFMESNWWTCSACGLMKASS
ncbi:WLM domain-containing protein [Macrophomina phaseolina]|uniref:WLM domain-containing protein n=1 Tax=Macrophomina phaseolina TaxID=35725 RepID=A0ABQ8GLW8_9PEZI|nr:WLM domain-containing protein [Macrophomina phaseolina]